MKRTFSLVFGLLLFIACSKQERSDNTIRTVFENSNLKELRSRPFNPFLNDYTTKIEQVGYNNQTLLDLRSNVEFASIAERLDLDISNIRRHYYDFTPMHITFFPFRKNAKEMLVVYYWDKNYYFAVGKEVQLSNGNKHVVFSSVNATKFYEFQVNEQNKLGNFISYASPFVSRGNNERITQTPPDRVTEDVPFEDIPIEIDLRYGCCAKPWNDCMNCFYKSCGEDWRCGLVCSATVFYCSAAWAGACITKKGCGYPGIHEETPPPPKLIIDTIKHPFTPVNP